MKSRRQQRFNLVQLKIRIGLILSVRYIWRLLVFLVLFVALGVLLLAITYVSGRGATILFFSSYLPASVFFGLWLWSGKRLLHPVNIGGIEYHSGAQKPRSYWLDTLNGWWGFTWRKGVVLAILMVLFSKLDNIISFVTIPEAVLGLLRLSSPLWAVSVFQYGVIPLAATFLSIPLAFLWITVFRREPGWFVYAHPENPPNEPSGKRTAWFVWLIFAGLFVALYELVATSESGIFVTHTQVIFSPGITYIYHSHGANNLGYNRKEIQLLRSIPSSLRRHAPGIIVTTEVDWGTPFDNGGRNIRVGVLGKPHISLPSGWKTSTFLPAQKVLMVHVIAKNLQEATRYAQNASIRFVDTVFHPYAAIIRSNHHYEFIFPLHPRLRKPVIYDGCILGRYGGLHCPEGMLPH